MNQPVYVNFLRNYYSFLIKPPPPWWDIWLFQTNCVYDTSEDCCWFRAEQIETGIQKYRYKNKQSSGVKLPMWKIALRVTMLFSLLLRLELLFTSNVSAAACFPGTACVCGRRCSVLCVYERTGRKALQTGPGNFCGKIYRLFIIHELFAVV